MAFKNRLQDSLLDLLHTISLWKSVSLTVELEHQSDIGLSSMPLRFKDRVDHRKFQLNELSELRDQALREIVNYKERTKKFQRFARKKPESSMLVIKSFSSTPD
ncbi:hypothetical protein Tco_1174620 [Tanacetum coccineum]